MNQAKSTSTPSHAEIALKRLRHLCENGNPLFLFVQRAATALGQVRAQKAPANFKVKPDLRTFVAATLGASTFNDIEPLAKHEFDEAITPALLTERRLQQAIRLAALLSKTAEEQGLTAPADIASHAVDVINAWQPTTRQPEVKVHLANQVHEDVMQHFGIAQLRMEFAVKSLQYPLAEDVENACTVLRVLDPSKLIARQENLRQAMMADMGILAVSMANNGKEDQYELALQIFEALYKQDQCHAGVHVARMRFEGWGIGNRGRDIGKANSAIDNIFEKFISGDLAPFQTRLGLEEMLALRIRIKHELIVNGKDNPQVVFKRTKELIDTLIKCLHYEFEGYGSELAMLLAPHNPRPNDLRKIINAHDELRTYCLQMHEDLCAHARAEGLELPEWPSPAEA
jgi:hypothetical protein